MNHDEWRQRNQRPVNDQHNYPSRRDGGSATGTVLRVIVMICSLIGLFASIGRYQSRKNRAARQYEYPQQMREAPQDPSVPYLAFDDINELNDYRPTDTAFTKRSTRIATMHTPAIEREGDTALARKFRKYSGIAQARTLYLDIHQLSVELARLCASTESFDSTVQKSVRRLTRLGKEYNYDVTRRAGGAILKNPLLQKINPDATSFNQRVIRLLDRSNETLAYLNECVRNNGQPDPAQLKPLTDALNKSRIPAEAFESRDKRLHSFMSELGAELLQNSQIRNGQGRRISF